MEQLPLPTLLLNLQLVVEDNARSNAPTTSYSVWIKQVLPQIVAYLETKTPPQPVNPVHEERWYKMTLTKLVESLDELIDAHDACLIEPDMFGEGTEEGCNLIAEVTAIVLNTQDAIDKVQGSQQGQVAVTPTNDMTF